jgi:DNA-binding response OmpR family regulator
MVYRLRKRMAQHDNTREYIMTVRGHGFRLHPDAIA